MKDGRRTTFKERKRIVHFCLRNGKNYQLTSMLYDVSYSQVYRWVKIYETGGYEMLREKRGFPSPESLMSPEQRKRVKRRICRERRKKPTINAEFVNRMVRFGNAARKN